MYIKLVYVKNKVYNYCDTLIKSKMSKTKNILIVVSFARHGYDKSIIVLSLFYHNANENNIG